MAKQQQQNDDGLFDNAEILGFENALIDVDTPATDELENELSDGDDKGKGGPGSGDPGKVKKPGTKEPGKTQDNTILVDVKPEDEIPEDEGQNKKAVKDKKGGGTQKEEEENESPVYLHAAALQESGVLPNFDLKVLDGLKPDEAILKINEHIQGQIDGSVKDGIEEYKSSIGEKALEIAQMLEDGVSLDDVRDNYTLEERYGKISTKDLEKDEKLQEQIYSDLLALKGFSDAKIRKMVELAKEKEILLEESSDGLGEIQDTIKKERIQLVEDAKLQKKQQEERNEKAKETVQAAVNSVKEIFPGVEISAEEKKELVKMITVPATFITKDGRKIPVSQAMALRAKNPIAYELRLAYFIKNGLFDEKLKPGAFDVFTKKIETSATKRLASILDKEKGSSGRPASEVDKEKNNKKKENSDFVFPQDIIQ